METLGIALRDALEWFVKTTKTLRAFLWRQYYLAWFRSAQWLKQHINAIAYIAVTALILVSAIEIPGIQNLVVQFYSSNDRLGTLRSFLVTLGGALVGATAIAFSVVMFAVQINFARMPYGLFRRLTADFRLLGAFAGTFFLAVGVGALSLLPDVKWIAIALVSAIWATVLTLVLFLYAYRRALALINPLQQINFIVQRARNDMRTWARAARRVEPLIEGKRSEEDHQTPLQVRSTHDMARAVFFRANPYWTDVSRQAITHVVSFSRRYAEEGDYEVAGAALNAMLAINGAYIAAKGKTFFAQHLMFDNPLATDTFINETLESLRQNAKTAIKRADEKQIEQTFKAIAGLVQLYMAIDYSDKYAQEKQHAQLAAGYLTTAVEAVVAHNIPDVLMEGVRLMGECAQLFLRSSTPNEIVMLAEKMAAISCVGIVKEDFRPVTLTGMDQLARLTFDLIRTKYHDIHFAAGELEKDVKVLVRAFLSVPDSPLVGGHSMYLAPYYSLTNTETLPRWLTNLANELANARAEDEKAAAIIRNIEQWAEELYQTEKELLLLAIERRSHFTFDMIHWIAHLTKLLTVISQAPACDQHTKEKIIRHACWLISVLSSIPLDKDTVSFVETFQMTETLFEAALDARERDCDKVYECARDLLATWAFKAGRHHVGWAILERSMYGLATLALWDNGDDRARLKARLIAALRDAEAPDQELRDGAARQIRRRAEPLYQGGHWSSRIENAMSQIDPDRLGPLLIEIADSLSPATAGERIHTDYF